MTTPTDIRRRLLKERGLTTTKEVGKHKHLIPATTPRTGRPRLTPLMRYLEQKTGKRIEELLQLGSLNIVAKVCNAGEVQPVVDRSTLCKWIKRLRLKYNEDNLPDCNNCGHYGPACDSGICYQLIEQGRYDLIEVKKKEVLNESG